MLGPKIDARLNLLGRKLADLTHKIERIDALKQAAVAENGFGALLPGLQKLDEMIGVLDRRLIVLETVSSNDTSEMPSAEKLGLSPDKVIPKRGRPPKAKNG